MVLHEDRIGPVNKQAFVTCCHKNYSFVLVLWTHHLLAAREVRINSIINKEIENSGTMGASAADRITNSRIYMSQ